jgi:hypothetical protein
LHFGLEFAESGHPVVVLGLTFGDRIVLFKWMATPWKSRVDIARTTFSIVWKSCLLHCCFWTPAAFLRESSLRKCQNYVFRCLWTQLI